MAQGEQDRAKLFRSSTVVGGNLGFSPRRPGESLQGSF